MANKSDALKKYISKELKKGFGLQEIRSKLITAGYGAESVDSEISKFKARGAAPAFNWKYLIGILVILVTVAVVYLVYTSVSKPDVSECDNLADEERDLCLRELAFARFDYRVCSEISYPLGALSCKERVKKFTDEYQIAKKAVTAKDYSLCKGVELCEEYFKEDLLAKSGSDYRLNIIDEGRYTECLRLNDTPQLTINCYLVIAKKLNTVSICESITENSWNTVCRAFVGNNARLCEGIEEEAKYKCLALISNDVAPCNNLAKTERRKCYNYLKTANIFLGRITFFENEIFEP